MGSYRMCFFFKKEYELKKAEPPHDVKNAFKKYSEGGSHMTAQQLRQFLLEVQGETGATISDAESIIERILQKRHHIITLNDFHHYLFDFDLNPPIGSKVHQDMNAPLSDYMIYTGHNSYLTGNQLTSPSSDVPIINALERGVRVIELDLWPNAAKDDVDVLHGRTLTSPVKLIKCLESIKKHAFAVSPYPVIITLEDHLKRYPDLQVKVAQMVTQTFGEVLFYPKSEPLKEFPSPEELKYRILISTKPPEDCNEAKCFEDTQNNLQKEKDSDDDILSNKPLRHIDDQENDDKSDSDESCTNQGVEDYDEHQKLHPTYAYKRLISIHASKPKGGLKVALAVENDKVRRLSLSEKQLEEAAETHGMDIVRFTQKHILRVYPKGTRFNSSNYNPLVAWMHGAQMVAFNMQGDDESLWLMHGMFRSNGGCGYVKKPDFLMNNGANNQVFDPKSVSRSSIQKLGLIFCPSALNPILYTLNLVNLIHKDRKRDNYQDRGSALPKAKLQVKKTLKVKVYMGDGWHLDFKQTYFDLYSPPDFYARVGIAGVPADEVMKKTKVKNNDWTPIWDEEFKFPLTVPELALLRIEVYESDAQKEEFAGQTCLPISELRSGFRAVTLCDSKGEKYTSVKLLMRFEFV